MKNSEKTKQSLIDLMEQGINPFGQPDPDCDKCELVEADEYSAVYYCSCEEVSK
jgi:hypothetical protein